MKVTLKDIHRLQEDVEDEIADLSRSQDTDYDELARLRTMNFNLSMISLRYSMEKETTEIELGGTDSENAIVDALESSRIREVHRKVSSGSSIACVENLAQMAMDLVEQIGVITSGIKLGRNAVLMKNINTKFLFASEFLTEIASLKDNPEKISVWKSEEISSAGTAAAVMGRTKSAKKSAAARINGKKGGRPRKNPLPESSVKKAADAKKSKKVASVASKRKISSQRSYAVAERRLVPPAKKVAK
ncbi:MAG: hypothetical protein II563_09190 [Treponema sp.]|nr:hypothetical protein [Treponema sp.]MBQ2553002.1 hypothetical protein [Treponema sp.]MBQ5384089.1 hypothetical protein [Treponema sp.]